MNQPRPHLVHIETLGCQMNEYDTELIRSLMRKAGYEFTSDRECADVLLLNTCAIREHAHSKVYGHLAEVRMLKKQRPLIVGVLGCMAQNLKEELTDSAPLVDVLVGPDGYRQLPSLIDRAMVSGRDGMALKGFAVDLSEYETYEGVEPERQDGVNAWIAIMRGCDNFCSFCVVPYTRGRERSRDPLGIVREAEVAVAGGHKQVTLLGQNVNSYRFEEWDFARLITAVADVPGLERVRFTSPHPKDFPPALLDAIAQHPHICKHIHLPLQSGNDRILGLMNRTYTAGDYMSLVESIRRRHAGIALSTDIICGFCSETEAEFGDTYRLVEEIGFNMAYVFTYSERKNTIAARKYLDDVSSAVKTERVNRLVDLQKRSSASLNERLIGSTVEVMVEGDSKRSAGQWMGKTDPGITVVWEKSEERLYPGSIVPVTIHRTTATTLFGNSSSRIFRPNGHSPG